MKNAKTNLSSYALIWLLLSSMLCCCNDDRTKYNEGETNELKMVTFSVKVPGANVPKTYALTESDENDVSSIAILLFDGSGNYTYQPIYSNTITTDPSDNRIKTFTVQVPEGSYDLVILANARTSLANVLGDIFQGNSKESVLNRLLLKKSDKWNTTSGSAGYIPIPMWGEIPNLTINGNMSTNAVSLKRMISKIDLTLSATAQNNFNLESVRLYNYYDQGQIAPYASNWSSTDNKVTAPSVPGTAQKPTEPVTSPQLFDGTAITKDLNRGISCTNEIYTFESLAGSTTDMGKNTCLVVGGFYDEDTQPTYYRVDFSRDAGATTTYLPLLRNHRYRIDVTEVKGAGYRTPEEAFNARPVNIVATVVEWNEALITDIKFDGQYLLGVSQGEFTFTREERKTDSDDNTLFVSTDYPTGWKVAKIVDAEDNDVNSATNTTSGWLELSPAADASGATVKTRLLLKENNTSQTRTAFIHLTAGRLTYIVKVVQNIAARIFISITNADGDPITVLDFPSKKQEIIANTAPAMQTFKLDWSPSTSNLFYTSTTTSQSFEFLTGAGLDLNTIPSGGNLAWSSNMVYKIQPPTIMSAQLQAEPFYERSSIYFYSVSDGLATISKSILFRQFAYNMVPVVDAFYLMDGGNKSFKVRSNSPFTVELETDTDDVMTLLTTAGGANTTTDGTTVNFKLINDIDRPTPIYNSNPVVVIKSTEGVFPDTRVTLHCFSGIIQPESNSYVVSPGSKGILIPVSRANGSNRLGTQVNATDPIVGDFVWTDDGTQVNITDYIVGDFLWTDNSNGLRANSTVSRILSTGGGKDGYILVVPGTGEGNAVVAGKKSTTTLWSWHIWVTNYVPVGVGKNSNFMDRNLGALGNTPGNLNTRGLMYQWGRKDPFPPASTWYGTDEAPMYNASRGVVTIGTQTAATTTTDENFTYAFRNPITIINTTGGNYDWVTNANRLTDNNIWGGDTGAGKTVYDPCPEGWRVPNNNVWQGVTYTSATNGYDSKDYGGYYPFTGYRNGLYPNKLWVTGSAYYWTASYYSPSSFYVNYMLNFAGNNNATSAAHALAVRCVKE